MEIEGNDGYRRGEEASSSEIWTSGRLCSLKYVTSRGGGCVSNEGEGKDAKKLEMEGMQNKFSKSAT